MTPPRARRSAPPGSGTTSCSTRTPPLPADVLAALGRDTAGMGDFACMDALSELTGTTAPAALSALRSAEERFGDVVSVSGMNAYVEDAAVRILA